jgi:glutathione S-transferase
MLTLHYAPHTISLASLIALEEAGADYEVVRVDFSAAEQRGEAYRKINPKARVPALVTDQGILTETPAILLYIAQTHPQARLAPLDDAFALARLNAFCAYLCSTVHPSHSMRMRGARWSDDPAVIEALKVKVPANVAACCALIEAEMFKGPWLMGETFTFGDAYLFNLDQWLEADGVDPAQFPILADHRVRTKARPAVQRALEVERS